jgi:large subunit ribosomal protein L5
MPSQFRIINLLAMNLHMRLKELYQKEITVKLKEKFHYKNRFEVPMIKKAVINVGVGRNAKDKGFVEEVANNIRLISGQKPLQSKAKKSISAFKIRQGMIVGVTVTLRGKRMYDFVEKVVNIAFPRVRDFRGISEKHVDNQGNLTIGFKEQTIFPEIKDDDVINFHGLEISIATSAKTKAEGLELFKLMGFPFKKEEEIVKKAKKAKKAKK